MELGKACFTGSLFKLNPGLISRGKQVAPTTQAAKNLVVDQLRHEEMILPAHQPAYC